MTYRNTARGGSIHGHRNAEKMAKIGHVVPGICSRTDRQTDTLITVLRFLARGAVKMLRNV